MNDIELLGLTATAANIPVAFGGADGQTCRRTDTWELWNPLTDDGDALRLAVKLDLIIEPPRRHGEAGDPGWAHVYHYRRNLDITEQSAGDRDATVRRAITRAAAEIGKMRILESSESS